MAEIFLAKRFAGLGAELQTAIKRILPSFIKDDSFGDMLIQEAKLCARLSHANIVYTYDLGKVEGLYYIAMEYVEGLDLNKLLGQLARSRKALPLQFAFYIIIEALRGLDYAHRLADEDDKSLGIIHRDISPTNILISTEGEIKICDFGIAKVALTREGAGQIDDYHLKGKIAYMSPEHLNGDAVDHRADVYATGILLWELLSGRRLFKSRDEDETLRRARAADVPQIKDRGFPEFEMLGALVMKALAKRPEDRFGSCREFIEALEDYVHAAGFMVSQLKFKDFLMENFGESLLEQRRERERNLAGLDDYRKTLEAEEAVTSKAPTEAAPSENGNGAMVSTPSADALLASFTSEDEHEEDLEESGAHEVPKDVEINIDEQGDHADSPPEANVAAEAPSSSAADEEAKEERLSLENVWQPDISAKKAQSTTWVAAGAAVVLVAAAVAAYFYFF